MLPTIKAIVPNPQPASSLSAGVSAADELARAGGEDVRTRGGAATIGAAVDGSTAGGLLGGTRATGGPGEAGAAVPLAPEG
jgi:hypothetical protein